MIAVCSAVQFIGQFAVAGPLSGLSVRAGKGFVASLSSWLLPHQPENSCVCNEKGAVISFITLLDGDSKYAIQEDIGIWVLTTL